MRLSAPITCPGSTPPLQPGHLPTTSRDQSHEGSLLYCDKTLLRLQSCDHYPTKDTSATPVLRPCGNNKSASFNPPIVCEGREWPLYLFEYNYDDHTWCFTIRATSMEDAQARVNRMYYATYVGEIGGSVPANRITSLWVRWLCFTKNLLTQRGAKRNHEQ